MAVNKERKAHLAEIQVLGLRLEGKPPELKYIKKAVGVKVCPHTFLYDTELSTNGVIKILVKTAYKINWPSPDWHRVPITLEIVVKRLNGKVRIQYSNNKKDGSYMQLLGYPINKVEIEPVVGEN